MPNPREPHGTVHRIGAGINFEEIPVFRSDAILKSGRDTVRHIQQRIGQGRSWGVAQYWASSSAEQVRQGSCPVGDVQNAAVNREDDDVGLGRGRCVDGYLWMTPVHRAFFP
jgi:hypothetical protein